MRRDAVVFVHGIPIERRPLDTLHAFTTTVFGPEWHVHPRPLEATDSYEARRFTATRTDDSRQIDVFEYDWHFLQTANRYAGLGPTAMRLLLRRPGGVPDPLFGIWRAIWLTLLTPLVLAAVLFTLGGYFLSTGVPAWIVGLVSSVAVIAIGLGAFRMVSVALTRSFVTAGLVSVARYLDQQPASYAARRAIRGGLVDLLHTLQQGRYDRVAVVGHGLGSHIAYDAIVALWSETHELHAETGVQLAGLDAVEDAARRLPEGGLDADGFQDLQYALWRELRMQGNPWRITDFITIGAPMAFADVTMARPGVLTGMSASEPSRRAELFEQLVRRGGAPQCPPRSETLTVDGDETSTPGYSWRESGVSGVLGAQAPFAVTRWTNLWFPVERGGLRGDWFGGALARLFGPGVRDVAVADTPAGRRRGVSHLKYLIPAGDEANGVTRRLRDALTADTDPPPPRDTPEPDPHSVPRIVHRSWQRSS